MSYPIPVFINPVKASDFADLNRFFGELYVEAAARNPGATKDELAASLGLLAARPVLGVKPLRRISRAAVLLCLLSPLLRKEDGKIIDYHGSVIRSVTTGKLVGISTIEENSDPRFNNRGNDTTRAKLTLYLLSGRNTPRLPGIFIAHQMLNIARNQGYRNLEAIIAPEKTAATQIVEQLGFKIIGQKDAPSPLDKRTVWSLKL